MQEVWRTLYKERSAGRDTALPLQIVRRQPDGSLPLPSLQKGDRQLDCPPKSGNLRDQQHFKAVKNIKDDGDKADQTVIETGRQAADIQRKDLRGGRAEDLCGQQKERRALGLPGRGEANGKCGGHFRGQENEKDARQGTRHVEIVGGEESVHGRSGHLPIVAPERNAQGKAVPHQ